MIRERKTKEEWQEIVNDFITKKQRKKDYCRERNIKFGAFRNWYQKLKPATGLTKKIRAESKSSVVSEGAEEITNKEFIGYRLVSNATKINLPNGIKIEVATSDIIGLVKKLMHVA
jgi:hypothetical protein